MAVKCLITAICRMEELFQCFSWTGQLKKSHSYWMLLSSTALETGRKEVGRSTLLSVATGVNHTTVHLIKNTKIIKTHHWKEQTKLSGDLQKLPDSARLTHLPYKTL